VAVTGAWSAGLVAAGAAALATPVAGRLARALGVVDRPGPLKVHVAEVAYLGGLGLCAGVAAAAAVTDAFPLRRLWPTALALALGVADDARGLGPAVRVGAEAGIGLVSAAVNPTRLPPLVGPLAVAAATVGLVNAINLVDGLDGLAGGVAAASAAGLAGLLDGPPRLLAAAVAGGSTGFLVHNAPPARIYLGDGGAYALGASLATLVAAAWDEGDGATTGRGWLACVAVAFPAVEVSAAFVRRRRAGVPWSVGDRRHSYDLLTRRGWSRARAAATAVGAQAALSAGALALRRAGPRRAAAGLAAGTSALLAAVAAVGALSPEPPTATGAAA